jgi:hypothetical protein
MLTFTMKRKLSVLLILLLTAWGMQSQSGVNGDLDKILLDQAQAMGSRFIAKDYAAFAKYTHPSVTLLMGGEEKMIAETTRSFQELESEGIVFLAVRFGQPSRVLVAGDELQCTLPQMIDMKIPGGKLTANTTLIAISRDNGQNWYFIDTSGNTITQMQKLIANLSPNLEIPEQQDPYFEEDTPSEP